MLTHTTHTQKFYWSLSRVESAMSAFSWLNFPPLPPIPQQSTPLLHSAQSQNNINKRKCVNTALRTLKFTEPLGTAMFTTILVVQLRFLESEFFSHFSSFDLEIIWIPLTRNTRKKESMKMIRVTLIREWNAIFGRLRISTMDYSSNWRGCIVKTERKKFWRFFFFSL